MTQQATELIATQLGSAISSQRTWGSILYNVKDPQYGADSTGVKDSSAAVQAAINYAQLNGGGTIFFPKGTYTLNSGITINYGRGFAAVTIDGNFSLLKYTTTNGTAITINPNVLVTDPKSYEGLSFFALQNFFLSGPNVVGTSIGISIGKTGYVCDAFPWNIIDNVQLSDFDQDVVMEEVRHLSCSNLVCRSPKTRSLHLRTVGNFCGDMKFMNCEFGSGTDSAIKFYGFGNDVNAQLRGVHFTDCDIYGQTGAAQAVFSDFAGYAKFLDIWFSNCVLDQGGTSHAYNFANQQNALMGDIHIHNGYATGFGTFIKIAASSNQANGDFHVNDNICGLINTPFDVFNVDNFKFINNTVANVTAISSITGASKNSQVRGNTFKGAALAAYVTISAAVLSAIIKDNFGNFTTSFLQNQGTLPATALIVADNLRTV